MAKDPTPSPTPEIQVTDAMRKAVYTADCFERGHVLDFMDTIAAISDVPPIVGGESTLDENMLPYIKCNRCGSTWIVVPHAGADYDDAERFLYSHLDPTTKLAKKIVRDKGERDKRPPKPPLRFRQP